MSGSTEKWYVDIWEHALETPPTRPEAVIHTVGPFGSERVAERAERGVLRNLRDDCWTEVRKDPPDA